MRVLHFCDSFSPLSETFIYDAVAELERQIGDQHVLTFQRANAEDRPFPRVRVVPRPGRWHPRRLACRVARDLGWPLDRRTDRILFRAHLTRVLEEVQPALVHAQFGPAGALIAPITAELGIPLVVTFHGYDVSTLPADAFWRLEYGRLFESAAMTLGVSSHVCRRLVAIGAPPERTRLQHNGSDLTRFSYSDPAGRFDGHAARLLHVGRLVEKKSPMDLVRAFHQARLRLNGVPELHLTIAGDGPLLGPLVELIGELGLASSVRCLGAVSHSIVQQLMHSNHIYVQPSKTAPNGDQEGLPVAIVEASASGLPIISTRHSGISEIVLHEQTGLLVDEGDVPAMAESIAQLAARPDYWTGMGKRGRQHVENNFALPAQAGRLVELYRELAA